MKKFQIKITKHLRDEIDRDIFWLKQNLIEDKSNILNETELEPEVQSKINLKLAPLNLSRLKVNKGVKTILNRIDTKTKMSSELNYNNLIVNKSNQFLSKFNEAKDQNSENINDYRALKDFDWT